MEIIDGLSEIAYEGNTRIAIGKFDGIHAGHQMLIKEMTRFNDDLKSVVFTFSYASEIYLKKDERIFTEEVRREKFNDLGVDYLVEYDLLDVTAKCEPEDFARLVLKERLHAKEIYCGPDLSFGYKGRGNVELLKSLEKELNIKTIVFEKIKYLGEDISSTRIREAIKAGDMEAAENMLRG